jgi:hypothetical protein
LSTALFQQTEPLRSEFLTQFGEAATGRTQPLDITGEPEFAAGREAIEDQFGVARKNILASLPRGGSLESALADLETGRARATSGLARDVGAALRARERNILTQGFATGFGAPGPAFGGFAQAGAFQAQQEAARRAASGAKGQGLGQLLGLGIGGAIGGPPGALVGSTAGRGVGSFFT